jgi:hypothetical protein
MSRRAAPKENSPAAHSAEGSPMSAVPNRFKQTKAPAGDSEPHTVGEPGDQI